MNSGLRTLIKVVLLLALAISLLIIAFREVNLQYIFHQLSQVKVYWVFLSLVPSIVAFISRAYRWNLLIAPLGYKPSLRKTTYALLIGYFANLAFPRLGEVTRCGSLSKAEKIPFNTLLGTVITERIIDLISLFICLVITAVLEYKRLGNFLFETIVLPLSKKLQLFWASPFFVIGTIFLMLAGVLFFFYYLKKKSSTSLGSKLTQVIRGFIRGLQSIRNLQNPWLFIFHSVFIWFLYFISVYICFFALSSTEDLGLGAALFLLVAGGIGMSAPVQGGIGVYHILVSQGLVLFGLSKQDGLTFATMVHSSQMLLVIVSGLLSLLLLFLERKAITQGSPDLSPGIVNVNE